MHIGFDPNREMVVRVSGRTYSLVTESNAEYDLRLLGWKQYCFTWKAVQSKRFYVESGLSSL